jgi:type III secretory pathway component EscS
MDLSKIKDSKALKVVLIIALPTLLVASYYGYKFVKKKFFNENSEL